MSIVVTSDVFCDGEGCTQWCNTGVTGLHTRAKEARGVAKKQGWKRARRLDFCPDCVSKDAHKEKPHGAA